jgi:hypothetical protein
VEAHSTIPPTTHPTFELRRRVKAEKSGERAHYASKHHQQRGGDYCGLVSGAHGAGWPLPMAALVLAGDATVHDNAPPLPISVN